MTQVSNKQARATKKVVLMSIVLNMTEDGNPVSVNLDPLKVTIIDRETKKPLFKEKK